MTDKEKETYLWYYSRNLLLPPCQVRVIKECPKTFWLEDSVDRKISKVQFPEQQEYVGYSRYCLYYSTEESAKSAYERMKKQDTSINKRVFKGAETINNG